MNWFQLVTLLVIQTCTPMATKILYVIPDNSTNASCPVQPCATLSEYVLDNGTLPVVSNVQYYFLPGEHHVPTNMLLQDLCNFSIIGTVKESPPPVVLVACLQSYVINVTNSYNVTIANVMFRQCDQTQLNKYKYLTNLILNLCYSCTIENIVFINLGLKGTNLIGNSRLTEILIKSDVTQLNYLVFCQGITLYYYWHKSEYKNLLMMNQIKIIGEKTGNKCYNGDAVGIHIMIGIMEDFSIIISNSLFYSLNYGAIQIRNRCHGNNKLSIENCAFEYNTGKSRDYIPLIIRPLIEISLSHNSKSALFKDCSFKGNYNDHHVISFYIKTDKICQGKIPHCIGPLTNISFVKCQFTENIGELVNINSICRVELLIIGPSQITKTDMPIKRPRICKIIAVSNMNVHLIGPLTISLNYATSIINFDSCDVLFHNNIIIKSNNCYQVITLRFTYIKVMEYTNITVLKNKHHSKLIKTEYYNEYKLYPLCMFQFVTLRNTTTISSTHYSINFIDNLFIINYRVKSVKQQKKCSFPFYHFTPHCQWIPDTVFHNYNPTTVYKHIIRTYGQNFTYHKICHCFQNGSYNCNIDTLGPVYPGQILQVELCTPCNDEASILYAEVNSINLPNSACKVAPHGETNYIYNYAKPVKFIIVSEATITCELFLATSSSSHYISEAFYVQLLSCPIGFTLQNGVCNCDLIISTYTDECYIDDSAIKHTANTWITAHTQTNSTKYLISECPMDYCLPYSSKLNLLYPDLQCQFNRSGTLCSQCQYHLSMVFGSSRCMECTNLSIILISVIVIMAGVVLVVLLYILNLTLTNGTISGIIFYANIVSINDSVFLVNDNMFKPLKVFISFVNLDLGIEICFYDGMDTYAKMWLQLFFPLYLLVIAISIIMISRYSSRILRLTYTRSLPVLATLFLLSYTGVLRTVSTVLFSYSTITHLPSGHHQIVWSIDASLPLYGVKFSILFITCLILFLLLIPFNIILLFTRYLSRFRMINYYKPLLDAFQGSYKDKYYYWIGLQLTMRSLFFAMYAFQGKLKLILSAILLVIFSICCGHIHPHKNKIVNLQELLLLMNLTIMYAVSYQSSDRIFSIATNVMISLTFIQLFVIIIYHFLAYTCRCNVVISLQTLKDKLITLWYKNYFKNNLRFNVELLNIPERTYNYSEYRDGLVSDDFN